MNRKLCICVLLFGLFVVSILAGGETKLASVEQEGSSAFLDGNSLDVYFFYGQGCPHCAEVEPFLAEMEQRYPLQLHKFDIYNNRSCLSLFDQYSEMYGLPMEGRGVPTLFVSDTYYVGDTPILDGFEEKVQNALKNGSVDNISEADSPESLKMESTRAAGGLSIVAVTVAALVDAISPCSIAILVFLIGARVLVADRRKRALKVGLAFCLSVFIAYFLFGLGLLTVVQLSGFSGTFSLLVGLIALLVGIFYLKDVFLYGKGGFVMEVPRSLKPLLTKLLKGVTSPLGAFAMGFVVSVFELPCTGGPYLFILGQVADSATRLQAIPLLLYYNFIFVLPLVVISLLLYSNLFSISKVRLWNEKNRRLLRLVGGLTMTALGILVIPGSQQVWLIRTFLSCCKVVLPPVLLTLSFHLGLSFLRVHKIRAGRFAGTILLAMLPIVSIFAYPQLLKDNGVYVAAEVGDADVELAANGLPSIGERVALPTLPNSEMIGESGDGVYDQPDVFAGDRRDSMLKTEEESGLTDEELAEKEERAELYDKEEEEYVYAPYPPVSNDLLKEYEPDYEEFEGFLIGDTIVYFRDRMIGDAIVEKDSIIYHFDRATEEMVYNEVSWREDLPDKLPLIIAAEEAEAKVEGEVQSSTLYFISPESDVFPVEPTPENPCWVVRSIDGEKYVVTIIDAVKGEILGYGISPPYEGFSLGGPDWGTTPPCPEYYYYPYGDNAHDWFEAMGYNTQGVSNPTDAIVRGHIQSTSTAMFYELAHGGDTYFHNICPDAERVTSTEVDTWIAGYNKMPFTFLGSCGGMCHTTDGYLSYEFRKGSTKGTVTVGYCGMGGAYCEADCWPEALDWQDDLFYYMYLGWTVKAAFDKANSLHPDCMDDGWDCMRFAGDTSLRVVPEVKREPSCGDTITGDTWLSRNLYCTGNGLTIGRSGITLDCQGHIIQGSNTGIGIINTHNGVTIKNCIIRYFDHGIYMYDIADSNTLLENTIYSNDYHGILLNDAYYNDITSNYVGYNGQNGLYLYDKAKYNDVINNDFNYNDNHGIQLKGTSYSNDFSLNYLYGNGWSGMGIDTDYNVITYTTSRSNTYHGFDIRSTTGNRLEHNTIDYNDRKGIYVYDSTYTRLIDNRMYKNEEEGVYLSYSNYTTIEDSDFDWNDKKTGLYLYRSDHNTIQTSDFYRNNDSIKLYYSDDNWIYDNTVRLSEDDALYLYSSSDNTISRNDITENGDYGIYMYLSDNNDILNNLFDDNGGYSVYMLNSDDYEFRNNVVNHPNAIGVFSSGSSNAVFENNTVCGYSWDFYTPGITYTADENTCDIAYQFVDSGQPDACDFECSGCRRPEDDLFAYEDLTFCPGTYNIKDEGYFGVIRAAKDGITLTCNNTILNGTGTGLGIYVYDQWYVTVRDCSLQNYLYGILASHDADYNKFINNTVTSMASVGIYIHESEYNIVQDNTITSNPYGIYLYSGNRTTILYNDAESNNYGIYFYSGSYYNYLWRNTFCSNSMRDIYNLVIDNSGDENLCDNAYNYADNGQTSACDFECSGCRKAEDDLVINKDTQLCPYTYNIKDDNHLGVIIIGAHNVELDCQGAEIIGVSTSSGWGIHNPGYDEVTVKNCVIHNYFLGIAFESGSDYANILNNNAIANTGGIRLWGSDYGLVKNNTANFNEQHGIIITQGSNYNILEDNTAKNNTMKGVTIYYSDNNELYHNVLCFNQQYDINLTSSSNIAGDENKCDKPDGYNDDGTTGCTYVCTECLVTFYTDPSTIGDITFEGQTYTDGENDTFPYGTSGSATAGAPEGWVFDHWQSTGNVIVSEPEDNPTDITIECGGSLTAIFKPLSKVVITSFYVRPSCFSPNNDSKKDTAMIRAKFTTQPDAQPIQTTSVDWTLRVKTTITLTVRTWVGTDGTVYVIWDGTDDAGDPLPDGEYNVLLQGRDEDGNLTKIQSRLVVIDTRGPKIRGWGASPDPFNPTKGETTTISYEISEKCYVMIKIYDPAGRLITVLRAIQPAGKNSMIWDGRVQGLIVPDGKYTYEIHLTDMCGNEAKPVQGTVTVKTK